MQAEVAERKRQKLRAGERRIATVAKGLLAGCPPERGGLECAITPAQTEDPDREIVPVGRVGSDEMRIPLSHDLEQRGCGDLLSAPEIEPLVVLLPGEPACGELDQFGTIQRQELH